MTEGRREGVDVIKENIVGYESIKPDLKIRPNNKRRRDKG